MAKINFVDRKEYCINLQEEWIPVEESLPSDDMNEVLITTEGIMFPYRDVSIGMYDNERWSLPVGCYLSAYKVIAWMPLPKPYMSKEG